VPSPLDRREENQRAFLALCLALPERGREALAEVDLERHFTSDLVRRAAAHLREHFGAPGEGLPDDDPELAALIAELAVRAGGEPAEPVLLEVQSLQLELASIERQVHAAVAEGRGDVVELAQRRQQLKRSFDRAQGRALDATGARTQ
jgi:hypothetical protein